MSLERRCYDCGIPCRPHGAARFLLTRSASHSGASPWPRASTAPSSHASRARGRDGGRTGRGRA
eukprot:7350371-Pyramimonas_sp.AAC.1